MPRIEVVPTILEVICRTTGLGFAAIARVTEDHWIACAVRDEMAFGLKPGGELQIETTICIASQIALAHHGTLDVTSSDSQTVFTFRMPVNSAATAGDSLTPRWTQQPGGA